MFARRSRPVDKGDAMCVHRVFHSMVTASLVTIVGVDRRLVDFRNGDYPLDRCPGIAIGNEHRSRHIDQMPLSAFDFALTRAGPPWRVVR